MKTFKDEINKMYTNFHVPLKCSYMIKKRWIHGFSIKKKKIFFYFIKYRGWVCVFYIVIKLTKISIQKLHNIFF